MSHGLLTLAERAMLEFCFDVIDGWYWRQWCARMCVPGPGPGREPAVHQRHNPALLLRRSGSVSSIVLRLAPVRDQQSKQGVASHILLQRGRSVAIGLFPSSLPLAFNASPARIAELRYG